jgi:hypothetical protein
MEGNGERVGFEPAKVHNLIYLQSTDGTDSTVSP